MFDFDAGKLIIVGIVALVFIPTKDLPRVLRQVGHFVGKMRRLASEFQGQFMDAMREADMADLRREAQKLSDAARVSTGLDTMHDIDNHLADRHVTATRSGAATEMLAAHDVTSGAAHGGGTPAVQAAGGAGLREQRDESHEERRTTADKAALGHSA